MALFLAITWTAPLFRWGDVHRRGGTGPPPTCPYRSLGGGPVFHPSSFFFHLRLSPLPKVGGLIYRGRLFGSLQKKFDPKTSSRGRAKNCRFLAMSKFFPKNVNFNTSKFFVRKNEKCQKVPPLLGGDSPHFCGEFSRF